MAAAVRADAATLGHPAYLILIGAILLSGLAGVAVRLPAAWREWRSPGPLAGRGAVSASIEFATQPTAGARQRLALIAGEQGYRVREQTGAGRWSLYGTRRGWSRLAALGSHAALVALIVTAAASGATSRESTFTLLPGEQAFLDAPRAGFTDAVRLDRFESDFGADGRPIRLDTTVTFLRAGSAVSVETLQVNRPGAFGDYLVHGWTYGPAARLRITTLGGRPLHDAAVPLDEERGGLSVGGIELSGLGVGIGLALVDPGANLVSITALGDDGSSHTARLRPGSEERVGPVIVRLNTLETYVTFLARSDPMLPGLAASSALLVASLAMAFWLPRRRLMIRQEPERLVVVMRGERFDDPQRELQALVARVRESLS